MAGHSKYKNIMHRKGGQDAKRARAFAKIGREITGTVPAPMSRRAVALYKASTISVDLPPPETPATQQKVPSGISAVTFFRLLPVAPMRRSIFLRSNTLRVSGIGPAKLDALRGLVTT